jgi:hypothetical protein
VFFILNNYTQRVKIYLFLVLLIVSNTFAQEKTYTFSKNRLQQVRKFSYNINPMNLKKKIIKIARYDTIKKPTQQYQAILEKIEKSKKDSITELQKFKTKELSYIRVQMIAENLKQYLNSESKFKEKKDFLIKAQIISDSLDDKRIIETNWGSNSIYDKNGRSTIIYSDKEFNSENKDIFKDINSSNKTLNNYYSNMVSNILNLKKPSFDWKMPNYQINYNRNDGEPAKFEIILNFKDSISVNGLIGKEFDYLNLSGNYKVIPKYYQKSSNQYLLSESIKNINLSKNDIYEMLDGTLLQNTNTYEYIKCNPSFLSEYDLTKNDDELKKFNDEYLIWKTKYLSLTKSAQNNVTNCNAILKRNTFINVLGQSVWNADKISKKDKIDFNNNYDSISDKLSKIGLLEQESQFYNYYLDNVKDNEGIEVYGISLFLNNARKFNLQ